MNNFVKVYYFIFKNLSSKKFDPIDAHLLLHIIRYRDNVSMLTYRKVTKAIKFAPKNIRNSYKKLNDMGYINSKFELTIPEEEKYKKISFDIFDKLDTKELLVYGYIKLFYHQIRETPKENCFEKWKIANGTNLSESSVFRAENKLNKLNLINKKTIWINKNISTSIIRLVKQVSSDTTDTASPSNQTVSDLKIEMLEIEAQTPTPQSTEEKFQALFPRSKSIIEQNEEKLKEKLTKLEILRKVISDQKQEVTIDR